MIARAVQEFGRVDVLVSNAAFQMTREVSEQAPDELWDRTLAVNLNAFFHLAKAAAPHMQPGSSIIGSTSVNSDSRPPTLRAYSATKVGITNLTAVLAHLLADRGIRANSVAPAPVRTPLVPAIGQPAQVPPFGPEVPMSRAGQPAELVAVYVMLASDAAGHVSGARIAVGGRSVS